jgi:hypothetical protein
MACRSATAGFALLTALIAAPAARSSPALPGFTGVLVTPTPFSQAFQSGAAGVSGYGSRQRFFLNYGAWETGELTLSGDPIDLRAHAKLTLRPETGRGPAVAVGVTELFGGDRSLYAVAGGNLRMHASGSQLRLSGGLATRGALDTLFAGAEVRVSHVAVLQAEWSHTLNFGLRLDPTAQFRVLVGLVQRRGVLGVSYDIGL